MKKLFALILALCLLVGLMPMAAMAEDAETPEKVTVYFRHDSLYDDEGKKTSTVTIKKQLADGDIAYVTSNDDLTISDWTEDGEPSDKFAKLEYDFDSATVKLTLKNFKANFTPALGSTCHGIEFSTKGAYSVAIELIGENLLQHSASACMKAYNDGGITITGTGAKREDTSLTLKLGDAENAMQGSGSGALWMMGGDLVIKNTTLNTNVYTATSPCHPVILTCGNNVTFEGVNVNNKTNNGGPLVLTSDKNARTQDQRYTLDTNPDRKVTFKDCTINSQTGGGMTITMSPVILNNTTVKAIGGAPLFRGQDGIANPPTIEGDFSAAAGLKKNAEKPDKWKEYNPKKLKDYTFLYIVPGIVELVPTEETEAPTTEAPTTEATEAPTTEATEPTTADNVDTTKPTTADKDDTTKPTTADKDDKTDDKTDKTDDKKDEKSGSPLKVILIVLIALIVVAGAAVGVIFYLRSKNAELEEGEEEEEEEEDEEAEESEEAEAEEETEE